MAKTAELVKVDEAAKAGVAVFDASQYKEKMLTVPQLKLQTNVVYIVKPTSKIKEGAVIKGQEGKPPRVVEVLEMQSGISCVMICNKDIEDAFTAFGNYVGEIFKIAKGEKVPTKGGRSFCPCFVSHLSK